MMKMLSQLRSRRTVIDCLWIALVIVADQLTKSLARQLLSYGDPVGVIPGFFNLTLVFNRGAAWGMMAGFRIFFVILAVAMLVFLAFKREHVFGTGMIGRISCILLSGGIIGNAIDRAYFGYVTDFIDLWHGCYHFPCFNVADSAICIGVALCLFLQRKAERK